MDRRAVAKSLVIVLPLVVLTACGEEAPETAPVAEPAAPAAPAAPAPGAAADIVAMGEQVYNGPGICFSCHGPAGQGSPLGPDLTDDNWLWIENPQENLQAKLVTQIRTGVAQPKEYPAPMPPMGGANLTEEQLQAVAAYVASL